MITITTPPAQKAMSLSLLKEHLRIIGNDEDATLSFYLDAAILTFENFAGSCLITQTVKQVFDQFPCEDYFLLERGRPIISVSSVKYYDLDNTLTTFSTDNYLVTDSTVPPSICLKPGKTWPELHRTRLGAVEVTYTAGYGTTEASVPMDVKLALSLMVGDFYQNREDSVTQPGVVMLRSNWHSMKFIQKYKSYFSQHPSQSRKIEYQDTNI